MRQEAYHKPKIRSEVIEIGAYGDYEGPIPQMQPLFGLCCPGGG